ncbi:MAG TPA: hypothetical protein VGH90_06865 [Chthoniobacteraceae bacterium]
MKSRRFILPACGGASGHHAVLGFFWFLSIAARAQLDALAGRNLFDATIDARPPTAFFVASPGEITGRDRLVFQDGGQLDGTLLQAASGERIRWRMANGQERSFDLERIAGVRIDPEDQPSGPVPLGSVELRNGDRLRGDVVSLDANTLKIKHPYFGDLVLPRAAVWKLDLDPLALVFDEEVTSSGLPRLPNRSSFSPLENHWIHFDGAFLARAEGTSANQFFLAAPARFGARPFEIRFDVANSSDGDPTFYLVLSAPKNDGRIMIAMEAWQLRMVIAKPQWHGQFVPSARQRIDLREKLPKRSARANVRAFVDPKAGTCDLFIDGVAVMEIGRQGHERVPGLGEFIQFAPEPTRQARPTILSNLWIGPWSGESPLREEEPKVTFTNGDVTHGRAKEIHEGKAIVASDLGDLETPAEKIGFIELGGRPAPKPTANRIRLMDGSSLNITSFRCDGHDITVQSETFGDLHLPSSAVSELVLDPAPPRAPHPIVSDHVDSSKPSAPKLTPSP